MVLNIGKDEYILVENIITILDRDSVIESEIFNEFIDKIEHEDRETLDNYYNPEVKSFLVVEKDNKTKLYTSKISSKTLFKRSNIKKWR